MFGLTINHDDTISYTLKVDQENLWRTSPEGPATPGRVGVAHIHLGSSHAHGAIMFEIYSPKNGPFTGKISGTLTADDLVVKDTFHGGGIPRLLAQYGIVNMEDALEAIRNCNVSVIVHTSAFWIGEIAGDVCRAKRGHKHKRHWKYNSYDGHHG